MTVISLGNLLHAPCPSGSASLTNWKAFRILWESETFKDTVLSLEEEDVPSFSSPSCVKHPAKTLYPRWSSLLAIWYPKLEKNKRINPSRALLVPCPWYRPKRHKCSRWWISMDNDMSQWPGFGYSSLFLISPPYLPRNYGHIRRVAFGERGK